MNSTYFATFPTDLIKGAKTIVNQKINFLRDTKRRIQQTAINNGCHILHEICGGKIIFKLNFLSRLIKPIELTH